MLIPHGKAAGEGKMIGNLKYRNLFIALFFVGLILIPGRAKSQTATTKIIYLALGDNDVENLWIVDLADPTAPEQVTSSYDKPGTRLYDYQITADGRFVAYVLNNTEMPSEEEIILLDLQTHQTQQLTNCTVMEADCYEFSLRPNGHFIAYYLVSPDSRQIRVIDLNIFPYADIIIDEFDRKEPFIHHALPSWVGNTGLLTYNLPSPDFSFQLYDVEKGRKLTILPLGTVSRMPYFSPDGSRYAYYQSETDMTPRIIQVRETNTPAEPISTYDKGELSEGWIGGGIEDWHPDNEQLLIRVQYLRTGPDMTALQFDLAIFNTTTGKIEYLTNDLDYAAYNASWNADATYILYQRCHRRDQDDCSRSQIMIYEMSSGEITPLPIFGMFPNWVNP